MNDTLIHHSLGVEAALDALRSAGFTIGAPTDVRRVLLDTFDGRLHSDGIRVEHHGRSLVVAQVGSPTVVVPSTAAPRFAEDLPPGPLRQRLADVLEERALQPLIAVEGRAVDAERRNSDGKVVAAVTITSGAVAGTEWVAEIAELRGHDGRADDVAATLRAIGAEPADGGLTSVAAAAAGVAVEGIDLSPTIPLDGGGPAIDGFGAALSRLDMAIEATWDGTAAEIDVEYLHDLRVAIRRTRSVLNLAKGVIHEPARAGFADDFRWLGEITSRVRDLDVYLLEWPGYAAELAAEVRPALEPVRQHLVDHCRVEHARLVEQMSAPRATDIRHRWTAWLAEPVGGEHGDRPLGEVAARRLRSAQQRVIDDGRAIGEDSPAEDLHELRKRAKKLRYLLECFGGLVPNDVRKSFVRTLKGLQDNLGEFQDTQVHATELRTIALELTTEPGAARTDTILALGQLRERLEGRRARARAEFAERFAAYDTKATRKLVDEMAEAMRG